MKIQFLSIFIFVIVFTLHAQIPGEKDNRMLLPNGWWLSPAGEQIRLGDFPMNAALSEDEKYLAVSHSGYSMAEIWLMDLKTKENLDIAFGIYFYVIESPVGNKTGKIAIIK